MVVRRWAWLTSLALALFLSVMPAAAEPAVRDVDIAVLNAPEGTRLADILSGQARVGFTPLLGLGAPLNLASSVSTWVRLRSDLPKRSDGEWLLRIERSPIQNLRLYFPSTPEVVQAEFGFFTPKPDNRPLGAAMQVPLPAGANGPVEIYLEVSGDIRVGLLPSLVSRSAATTLDSEAARWLHGSLWGLGLLVPLALIRFGQQPSSGAGSVAFAALTLVLGILAQSGALYQMSVAEGLTVIGPMGLWMLLLLPCGPLLLATASYSGLPYSMPRFVPFVRGTALILPGVAVLVMVLRSELVGVVQVVVWLAWLAMGAASVMLLLLDSRSYRWAPIVFWLLFIVSLMWRAAAELQFLPPSNDALFAYQPVLFLLMASMLVFPWVRSILQQRQMQKRVVVSEPTSAEKISKARDSLMQSLQAGLDHAAEGDVEWIAFRRLLTGLKPVLPQLSSAVMAMNYNGQDLLQVEPMEAESRYRVLLSQRSSLLRGLSRSRGAQQIALDFDGDDGPLPQVQCAVIPLPIDKPGWGLLLVERPVGLTYSEEELELCTEFASLATTASEEAAISVRERHEAEIDPDTGVYRGELIEKLLADQIEIAYKNSQPVTVMRVDIDGLEAWLGTESTAASDALRKIGAILRDELEFGEALGRLDIASFLMVLHGRNANVCRPVAERIMASLNKLALPPECVYCIGISELRRGEANGVQIRERVNSAVNAARRSGTPATA